MPSPEPELAKSAQSSDKPVETLKSGRMSRRELLIVFDPSTDVAEQKYRELYEKLVRYFEWNRKSDPEDLAQEALRRGFCRLQAGQKITTDDPAAYFFGIARNLVRESWSALPEQEFQEQDLLPPQTSFHKLNQNEQFVLLKECLSTLREDDLEMLIAYMEGSGKSWCRKAGLQQTTLRSRVHRVRKQLEALITSKRS